jgi:hypothetical protein
MIADCAFLAAMSRLPEGDLLLDRIIMNANAVRVARKARWPKNCVAPLERDLIHVLTTFYRRVEWYRHPPDSPCPK